MPRSKGTGKQSGTLSMGRNLPKGTGKRVPHRRHSTWFSVCSGRWAFKERKEVWFGWAVVDMLISFGV